MTHLAVERGYDRFNGGGGGDLSAARAAKLRGVSQFAV
jgi:hypothetical protein